MAKKQQITESTTSKTRGASKPKTLSITGKDRGIPKSSPAPSVSPNKRPTKGI